MEIKLPKGIEIMQLCSLWVAGYEDTTTYNVKCFIPLTKKWVKDVDPPPPPLTWATKDEVLDALGI